MKFFRFYLGVALALSIHVVPSPGRAGDATEQLRYTINSFVTILSNTPVAELQARGLPEQARKLVYQRFDFSEMARLSLGSHWKALERAQQEDFVKSFTHRLLETYGRTVRASGNETIQYNGEVMEGGRITVETHVVNGGGERLPIDYRLHEVKGEWKVFDVAIDHVSLVANYRAQFNRVIAKSSVEELLRKLKPQDS